MKVIEEPWTSLSGEETVALSLDKDTQYTISEFIMLLEEAKKKFGDKMILFHDMNTDSVGGFSRVYLNPEYDEREEYGEDYYSEAYICIYG